MSTSNSGNTNNKNIDFNGWDEPESSGTSKSKKSSWGEPMKVKKSPMPIIIGVIITVVVLAVAVFIFMMIKDNPEQPVVEDTGVVDNYEDYGDGTSKLTSVDSDRVAKLLASAIGTTDGTFSVNAYINLNNSEDGVKSYSKADLITVGKDSVYDMSRKDAYNYLNSDKTVEDEVALNSTKEIREILLNVNKHYYYKYDILNNDLVSETNTVEGNETSFNNYLLTTNIVNNLESNSKNLFQYVLDHASYSTCKFFDDKNAYVYEAYIKATDIKDMILLYLGQTVGSNDAYILDQVIQEVENINITVTLEDTDLGIREITLDMKEVMLKYLNKNSTTRLDFNHFEGLNTVSFDTSKDYVEGTLTFTVSAFDSSRDSSVESYGVNHFGLAG